MKTKKIDKKLSLNKKTISNLSKGQLFNAKGGYYTYTVCTLCTSYTQGSVSIRDCPPPCCQPNDDTLDCEPTTTGQ